MPGNPSRSKIYPKYNYNLYVEFIAFGDIEVMNEDLIVKLLGPEDSIVGITELQDEIVIGELCNYNFRYKSNLQKGGYGHVIIQLPYWSEIKEKREFLTLAKTIVYFPSVK